eukprot:scaffold4278_cov129-Isochrysis_galbana.AAC.1
MQNEPHAAGGSERSRRPIGLFTALRTATATAARRRTQCIDDLDVDRPPISEASLARGGAKTGSNVIHIFNVPFSSVLQRGKIAVTA